jgi:hypothetical protein
LDPGVGLGLLLVIEVSTTTAIGPAAADDIVLVVGIGIVPNKPWNPGLTEGHDASDF